MVSEWSLVRKKRGKHIKMEKGKIAKEKNKTLEKNEIDKRKHK